MENSLFALLLSYESGTIQYVRSVTPKEAIRTLYLRAPENIKLELLDSCTVTIANFNQLVQYIRPELNRNTIDRYRREYLAKTRARLQRQADDRLKSVV